MATKRPIAKIQPPVALATLPQPFHSTFDEEFKRAIEILPASKIAALLTEVCDRLMTSVYDLNVAVGYNPRVQGGGCYDLQRAHDWLIFSRNHLEAATRELR